MTTESDLKFERDFLFEELQTEKALTSALRLKIALAGKHDRMVKDSEDDFKKMKSTYDQLYHLIMNHC
jgi:hypothetical protein